MTGTGDGVLAWKVLRRVPEYREAWSRHGTAYALEPGPFRIRVQAEADLEAARFGLLAWEDPRAEDGPASPFWRQERMTEGAIDPHAEPLAALAGDCASVEGLRLLEGGLVLKVECNGAAVQVLLRDAGRFPDGAGIAVRHSFGLRIPKSMRRLQDFWDVAGRPAPRKGRERRAEGAGRTGC